MADFPKAFVCGHPIEHSRSPIIHNHWLKHFGLKGSYKRIDVKPEDLSSFLRGLKDAGYVGGNTTLPHKEAVFSFVQNTDDAAKAIGAVNTLWFEGNELMASNTDAYGFAANLDDQLLDWRQARRAMVFGAGGASRAILYALNKAGFEHIDLVNRTLPRAQSLAAAFGEHINPATWTEAEKLISQAELLVNTTSLGMEGQPDFPAIFDHADADAMASDIVYTPLETPFLKMAKQRGQKTSDGLGMLLHQAVPGFEKWFGVKPAVDADLRSLVLADINKKSTS